jgi:hypothetical protein
MILRMVFISFFSINHDWIFFSFDGGTFSNFLKLFSFIGPFYDSIFNLSLLFSSFLQFLFPPHEKESPRIFQYLHDIGLSSTPTHIIDAKNVSDFLIQHTTRVD